MSHLSPDEILDKKGIHLPPAPVPKGLYKPFLISGNLAYVSGHGPILDNGSLIKGRAGKEMNADQAKEAARQTGLAILSTLKTNLGTLNKIKRVVKVLGMVNADPKFDRHPYVINGCSELFAEVFGEDNGVGVRSAVGMSSLPENITVEIEAIFELI
ncbi:MAG TPA: RidA family protein [Cyclobacteriaceae bacterium]|nr:RidA family protein [Cyclobacteriaceae bacterium]